MGPKWVDTPAVYGPLFTTVSGQIARVASSPAQQVAAYKWLAVFGSLGTLALVVLTTARVRPGRVTFAAAVWGLNPVVLFLTVGSATTTSRSAVGDRRGGVLTRRQELRHRGPALAP